MTETLLKITDQQQLQNISVLINSVQFNSVQLVFNVKRIFLALKLNKIVILLFKLFKFHYPIKVIIKALVNIITVIAIPSPTFKATFTAVPTIIVLAIGSATSVVFRKIV